MARDLNCRLFHGELENQHNSRNISQIFVVNSSLRKPSMAARQRTSRVDRPFLMQTVTCRDLEKLRCQRTRYQTPCAAKRETIGPFGAPLHSRPGLRGLGLQWPREAWPGALPQRREVSTFLPCCWKGNYRKSGSWEQDEADTHRS